MTTSVHARIVALTLEEFASALGLRQLPVRLRNTALWPLGFLAHRLAGHLAQFDEDLKTQPLPQAARAVLERFGVALSVQGDETPRHGPLLVIANHPGIYDAMSLFSSLGRNDLCVIVAEREFLRAMPHLGPKLIFVPDDDIGERAAGLRQAIRHLARGGAVLHFAAGRIEPDPDFDSPPWFHPWSESAGQLARLCERKGGEVRVAVVRGVHSKRAKRAWLVRWAERHGITTLSGLLQVALRCYAQVEPKVRYSSPLRLPSGELADVTHALQDEALRLATSAGEPA
jgi:hypothetical protein